MGLDEWESSVFVVQLPSSPGKYNPDSHGDSQVSWLDQAIDARDAYTRSGSVPWSSRMELVRRHVVP